LTYNVEEYLKQLSLVKVTHQTFTTLK